LKLFAKQKVNAQLPIISGGHKDFVYLAVDDKVLLDKRTASVAEKSEHDPELNLRKVYDFADGNAFGRDRLYS